MKILVYFLIILTLFEFTEFLSKVNINIFDNLIKVAFYFITFSFPNLHSIDKSLKSPKFDFNTSEKLIIALIVSKYILILIKKLKDIFPISFQQQQTVAFSIRFRYTGKK